MAVGAPCALVAPRVPVAAKVDIASLSDEIEIEQAHGDDVIVQRGIDMPCLEEALAVGMEEGDDRGDCAVIVVNDVSEIGHCFVTFVHRRYEGVGSKDLIRGVDGIDGSLPAAWNG